MIAATIIAAILILLAAAVAVAYRQADVIRALKAHVVRLEEAVTNEGDNERVWELRPDAVNPMIQRRRPDGRRPDLPPTRQPTRPPGETLIIDYDDIPDWGET